MYISGSVGNENCGFFLSLFDECILRDFFWRSIGTILGILGF